MRKSAACLLALALAAAQTAPAFAADPPQQAELADARAIVDTVMPPGQREEMVRTLMQQMGTQVHQALPSGAFDDPGLRQLMEKAHARLIEAAMPKVNAYLPKLAEAMAVAYTQEFGSAELKEIRAFAETPAGRRYLSRSASLLGHPAVAEANQSYFREVSPLLSEHLATVRTELTTYLQANPELAAKLSAANTAR
jgi:hypothetical protein